MALNSNLDSWLSNAGYTYHCFISWVHTNNPLMTECAIMIKKCIENHLALDIPKPRVFLDQSEIKGGAIWEQELTKALCRSIAMVSLCAPIYYHPDHRWCGLEWAAMENLSNERLSNVTFKSIIPVLIKKDNDLPDEVREIQFIDLSPVIVRGRYYFRSHDFQNKIKEIVERIELIAKAIAENQCIANCQEFVMPNNPAFINHITPDQDFPFRGRSNG